MAITRKTRNARSRQRRLDLLAKGICPVCGKRPHREGRTTCETCGKAQPKRSAARAAMIRKGAKALGLCACCLSRLAMPKITTCAVCAERHVESTRAYRGQKPKHECLRCKGSLGETEMAAGHRLCLRHRQLQRVYNRNYKMRKSA